MTISQSIISHQIWLQRLATQTANLSIPFVNNMRKEVREAVLKFGDDARTVTKLNKMLADLDKALADNTGEWKTSIEKSLREIADYENDWFSRALEDGTKEGTHVSSPSSSAVWSAIKFAPLALSNKPVSMIDMLNGWTVTEKDRLLRGVQSGFTQGLTTREIVKQVAGSGSGSLADVSQRNVMTVVRTVVNHVSTVAKQEGYNENSDILEGYELVITLDSKTSPICRNWPPGKVYSLTDGYRPIPPFHPGCRTTTMPKVSSEFDFLDAGAKRAARGADGGQQVDDDTSYYNFLKGQPAFFQDEALGPTRGKIFRNAGMTPEEFRQASVDGFNRPLTLEQMAATDKKVAEYLKTLNQR